MCTHHDYPPGTTVEVQIAKPGKRTRWYRATFLGTAPGAQMSGLPDLRVQTRDGKVLEMCSPRSVRPVVRK